MFDSIMPNDEHLGSLERKLLVTTSWACFGAFGLAFALSGFSGGNVWAGLFGFALFVAGFAAHVIINRMFGTGFTQGEVALGFVVFAVSASSFALSWLVLPQFPGANIAIGLVGHTALVAAFVFYMMAVHGVRGSIALIDAARRA
jgi:hypothetical protein